MSKKSRKCIIARLAVRPAEKIDFSMAHRKSNFYCVFGISLKMNAFGISFASWYSEFYNFSQPSRRGKINNEIN